MIKTSDVKLVVFCFCFVLFQNQCPPAQNSGISPVAPTCLFPLGLTGDTYPTLKKPRQAIPLGEIWLCSSHCFELGSWERTPQVWLKLVFSFLPSFILLENHEVIFCFLLGFPSPPFSLRHRGKCYLMMICLSAATGHEHL